VAAKSVSRFDNPPSVESFHLRPDHSPGHGADAVRVSAGTEDHIHGGVVVEAAVQEDQHEVVW